MSVTARYVVGREDEVGVIVGLLKAADRLPGVVVVTGEAGIGKTTLWLAGVAAAAERGYRVLSSRPSEAETRFSFAALTDLLGGAGEVVAALPPVQRRALDVALLLGEPGIQVDDRADVSVAGCHQGPARTGIGRRGTRRWSR